MNEGEASTETNVGEAASPESNNEASPAGVAPESVAVSGAAPTMSQGMNPQEFRDRMGEFGGGGQMGGGGGNFGGGGGPGFGGGGPIMIMGGGGGGRGRLNINTVHGNISETFGDAALDAKPYSLGGQVLPKPSYIQNRYSIALGGPLNIPKIYHGGTSTFFFLSYDGNRAQNPYDVFSTVPTQEERLGNFSATRILNGPNAGSPVQIFDPSTQLPFAGNVIPPGSLDPAAVALLRYIPLPNLPGDVQNFHFVTSVDNNVDNINFRLIHNFGSTSPLARGPGGGRGRGGRRGSNLNIGFRYQAIGNGLAKPFPTAGGKTSTSNIDLPVGYVLSRGRLTNQFRVDFNRSRTSTQNLYAFSQNLAGQLGINGVSQNPFDWGLPNLSFTNFTGVSDVTPRLERDQTFSISDSMIWSRGVHTLRWGGDFHRIQVNPETDNNSRGSFTFTGFNTAGGGTGTGFDLADFLLGLPQQTSAQFGNNSYYFRGNSWDLFVQDEWRVSPRLSLNVGLRYEYFSPYSEKYNRIVNLDAAAGFSGVAPVQPSQSGPFTGSFPTTLVNPDRKDFAPRLGIAWKPLKNTVVRAGYGINYNTGAFNKIVQNLAFQPPFSFTQTNVETAGLPLTLENGFPSTPAAVTNNYGVDRNYKLGFVQIWNFDIQQPLPYAMVLNLDYTGTKGTRLDMFRAPDRSPTGLLIAGVQPFLWESSEGNSFAYSTSVRLRRRFQKGLSVGGTYVFSKSIDNASSIGGGATVVAQNDLDLAAERGLSSFDQRHRLTADYVWELPLGKDKPWLSGKGVLPAVAGGWQLSGSFTIASGLPYTARVLGNFADVSRGTNGTLRADATGLPVMLANQTTGEFFNTAAFTVPPTGQFGNAQRNTISGPGTVAFNMAMTKSIPLGDVRALELRGQATNLFNTPQYSSIDTTVNSPSYGRVLTVGSMRRIQIVARFRF